MYKSIQCAILTMVVFLVAACSQSVQEENSFTIKSPEEIARAMHTAGQPVVEHKALSNLTGTWRAESMFRMSPDMPGELSLIHI